MSGPVLYLVRHGISEWNLLKKWQGQVDTNLASEGQEQAKKRGQSFKADGVNFDDAITSDLKRAAHTCQLLMSTCGKTEGSVNPDERLRECGLGEFEGMHKTTIYGEKYAELWSYLGNLSHEQRVRTPYFEGLETPLDVGTRAGQCLLEALMNNEDVTLLAVTHSTVIESLLACLFGADFDSIHTDNLCWIRFRVEQSRLVMDGSEGVHFKVSPDAIPISPSCMSSFQACGFKTLLGGSAGLLISMYLSTHGEAGRSEEVWGFCEGNHRISLHVGEFFSTIGAGLLAVSGLYTALQFNFKLQQGEELQRQRNAQLLALSVAAVGSCLTYAHITLSSEYMHLGEALTLWTLLFAVLSTGKSSDGTEAPRSATLFAFLYTLYWKSGFEPIALYSMIALTLVMCEVIVLCVVLTCIHIYIYIYKTVYLCCSHAVTASQSEGPQNSHRLSAGDSGFGGRSIDPVAGPLHVRRFRTSDHNARTGLLLAVRQCPADTRFLRGTVVLSSMAPAQHAL